MRTRYDSPLLLLVVLVSMFTGIRHGYLFGPDEPREAEIARETLADGHWVTPRLCGLPFLEKPPLYYDAVASAYALAGRPSPTAARSVSAAFGCVMLAATFLLARRWRNSRIAWLAALVLLTMPRFWRYSHIVLLDIAVGALAACSLASFARAAIWESGRGREKTLYSLSALFAAGAFLTKGLAAVFIIGVVILAFCAAERRWEIIRKLLSPLPAAVFLLPVGIWTWLFYMEGGLPYLHEHFVNNILGRFLQMHFEFSGSHFYHTDLGHRLPWYFYLKVLPEILGPWTATLPFAAALTIIKIKNDAGGKDRSFFVLLLIWSFLPMFLLSFSGIKERTYILPSYAAMAILTGYLLDAAVSSLDKTGKGEIRWLMLVFPFAALNLFFGDLPPRLFLVLAAAIGAFPAGYLLYSLARKRFSTALYVFIALMLCGLIASSSPTLLYAAYKRRCYRGLACETWAIVGENPLYLYRPSDNIRGSVCFYGERTVRELDLPEQVKEVMDRPVKTYVIMEEGNFIDLALDPSFKDLLNIIPAKTYYHDPDNMLICNHKSVSELPNLLYPN